MSDFMSDEHIVELVRHIVPHGQSQHAILHIERCGFHGLVLDIDILGREQSSEDALAREEVISHFVNGCRHAYIIPQIHACGRPLDHFPRK